VKNKTGEQVAQRREKERAQGDCQQEIDRMENTDSKIGDRGEVLVDDFPEIPEHAAYVEPPRPDKVENLMVDIDQDAPRHEKQDSGAAAVRYHCCGNNAGCGNMLFQIHRQIISRSVFSGFNTLQFFTAFALPNPDTHQQKKSNNSFTLIGISA
jgi:hypothetical protein